MLTTEHVDHAEGETLTKWMQLNWVRVSEDPFLAQQLMSLQTEISHRLFPTPYRGPACPVHVVGQDEHQLPIFSLFIPGKLEMRFKFSHLGHCIVSVRCEPGYEAYDKFHDLFDQSEQVTAEEASGFDERWLLGPYVNDRSAFTVLLPSASDISIFFLLGASLGLRFPYGS